MIGDDELTRIGDDELTRIGDDELTRIAARACMASALEPIGRGNNDGRIRHRDYPGIAVDCFGHEGNAEFLSHAQTDVLTLVDEVRRLREQMRMGNNDPDVTFVVRNTGGGRHLSAASATADGTAGK